MPKLVQYPSDYIVITQDGPGDVFYVITKGEVEVYREDEQGAKNSLRVMDAGGHFGEIALMKQIPRTATVRTLTPCEFMTFTHAEFLVLVEKNPLLRESFEHEVAFLLRMVIPGTGEDTSISIHEYSNL